MPISLRLPENEEKLIKRMAEKTGRTKTAVILEAISEKLGVHVSRKQLIKDLSGWMSHDDAAQLRIHLQHCDQVSEGDWE
jgi:predicted transcriptional regulator